MLQIELANEMWMLKKCSSQLTFICTNAQRYAEEMYEYEQKWREME